MKLFIAKNKKIGGKFAFHVTKEQVLKKPGSLIGLAAGKTTDGLYKLISKGVKKSPKKWSKLKLFQIDEKIGISADSPHSFNFEIRKELKALLKVTKRKNIFLIDGTKKPKDTIKEGYKFIKQNKGIDLIILGIGPEYDPHIAYNTTGRSPLNSGFRVVPLHPMLVKKTKKGITLGIKDILNCKKALLIACGKEKAKSLKLAFCRKVDTKRASASALQLHKNLIVVADKDAALLLQEATKYLSINVVK